MKLTEKDRRAFIAIAREVVKGGRYAEMKRHYSHSDVTVYEHCVKVAFVAYRLAVEHEIPCDRKALVRGALLHDYYLYDWHDPNKGFRWHGFIVYDAFQIRVVFLVFGLGYMYLELFDILLKKLEELEFYQFTLGIQLGGKYGFVDIHDEGFYSPLFHDVDIVGVGEEQRRLFLVHRFQSLLVPFANLTGTKVDSRLLVVARQRGNHQLYFAA